MKNVHPAVVVLVAVLPALLGIPWESSAQQTQPGLNSVLEVRVEGNKVLSAQAVLSSVRTRPGQPYSDEVVREDEKRLLATHRYDSVIATKTATDKGVIVTFSIVERPLIKDVQIVGAKSVKPKDLMSLPGFGTGDPIDHFQIESVRRAIESKYHSEGYYFAAATLDPKKLSDSQEVVYRITEGPRVKIRKISFRGNKAFSATVLKTKIQSKARFWPFIPGNLDDETVNRDIEELANHYRNEGLLDVRVAKEVLFSPDKTRAELRFNIEEGPRFRIGKVSFEGNTVFADAEIRRYLSLNGGDYYNGLKQRRDLEKIRELYGDIGYLDTQVTVKRVYGEPGEPASRPAGAPIVNLSYTIAETRQFRIGRIDIKGNRITKDNVIRRQLQFRPEQVWKTTAVEDTRNRLRETGLFEKVNITPFGEEPDVRNALVDVAEGKTAQFIIGAGVSSNAGLLGNITYTEKNFDIMGWPKDQEDKQLGRPFRGAGQVFSISVEPGTKISRARIDWHEPYLMDKPYSLGGRLYAFTAGRETYDETRLGGLASVGHRFKNRWYGELATRVEDVVIGNLDHEAPPDVREVEGGNFLVSEKGTLVRDTTDSMWLPSKGDRLSLSYEQAVGSFVFGKTNVDYHRYATLYTDALDRKHILAGRVSEGNIIGDAPVFERFYGGGLGSIRGFKYRGISPRQGEHDEPVGGKFSFFAGAEYSYPLIAQALRGVVFLDSGTVEKDFKLTTYRSSIGLGVRLQLPFFGPVPMSFDFGIPMTKDKNDDTQVFNFSVGWVF